MHDSSKEKGVMQEMELNGLANGEQWVIIGLMLFIFSTIYNHGIERFPWLARLRPAEQVVGGVLVTVLASSFLIGWNNAFIVLSLFVASGLPMLIGSWVRAANDDEEAKKIQRENLK